MSYGNSYAQDYNVPHMENLWNGEQMEPKCEMVESSRVHFLQISHQSSSLSLDLEIHNERDKKRQQFKARISLCTESRLKGN